MTGTQAGPAFAKGHGTGNDFVILPDPDGALDISEQTVRWVCDRRFGVGGDGLLRVVPTRLSPETAEFASAADWFMDYRNADGSIAEMCGNGARVFAKYLVQAELASPGRFKIATRGGVREVIVPQDGDVSVAMGKPEAVLIAGPQPLTVSVGHLQTAAIGVNMPNPHAVVDVADLAEAGDLREAPIVRPRSVFPDGTNVEFVHTLAPGHVQMRVHERGVGETLSCGTGACAVAWVHARSARVPLEEGVRVDVPGGTLRVAQDPSGELWLTGPALLVAAGRLDPLWWDAAPHA